MVADAARAAGAANAGLEKLAAASPPATDGAGEGEDAAEPEGDGAEQSEAKE